MALVSIFTVGRLNHPYDHPASREIFQVGNEVYRQAFKSGLIETFSPEGVPFPEETVKGKGSPILTLTVGEVFNPYIALLIQESIYKHYEIEADG